MPTPKNPGFNEPEYPEFDPTPYGGGYDIVSTYGKPLPPSDKICHPRSNPAQTQASHGEDLVDHKTIKQNGHPPSTPAVDNARNLDTPIVLPPSPPAVDNARNLDTPIVPDSREKPPTPTPAPAPAPIPTSTPESEYDYSPNGYNYPSEEKGYYDCGRQIPLPPNEYVEPCASLFGYWPCLLKEYQRDCMHRRCCEQDYASEWKKTEDYFFGNPYNYAETRDNGVGQVEYNYGYERHYREQASYVVEKAVAQVDDNYGYESHYAEKPNDVGDKSLALVDYDYGYERDAEKSLALVDYDYGYEKNAEKSLALVDYDYVYEGDAEKSLALVDYNYGYERDYIGQPSYAFEQSIIQVGAYEKHYAEQTSHVYEQPISQVDSNYGYGREYTEHSSYVVEQPVAQVDYNYAYDTHYVEQPTAQVDYNYGYESNYVEQPSYENAQPITQEDYSYGYGRQYAEQSNHVVEEPSYFEEEHSQQLWSQKLNYSYYESYQEP